MADNKQLKDGMSGVLSKELEEKVTGIFSKVFKDMQGEGVDKKTLEGAVKDSVLSVLKELDSKDGKKDDLIHRDTLVKIVEEVKKRRDAAVPDGKDFDNANYSRVLAQVNSLPETIKVSEMAKKLDGEFKKQFGVVFDALDNNPKNGKLTTKELTEAAEAIKGALPSSGKHESHPQDITPSLPSPSTPLQVGKSGKAGGISG